MNTEVIKANAAPLEIVDLSNIRKAKTEALRKALADSLNVTAKSLAYMAAIWDELNRRGEDLSALRSGIATYLPLIARGQLEAELVVKYADRRMLLNALSGLPIEDQKQIAETGKVRRVLIDEHGDIQKEDVPLNALPSVDIRYIFEESRLRTENEQLKLRQKALEVRPRAARMSRKVELDTERPAIVVGGKAVAIEKILPLLSEHYGFDVEAMISNRVAGQKAVESFQGKVK